MSKKEKDPSKKDELIPKWLKTIQLNSWEAELLISALVLYSLFQVPDLLRVFSLKTIPIESQLQGFFRILISAVELMKFGYILHILVRGIWVASVGLSYVFPRGINIEQLKFKGKFRKELESGSIVKNVLRLEELSSLIYGISFILFGALLGFGTFLFTFIYAMEIVTPLFEDNFYLTATVGVFILFYLLLATLVFFDFITNGLLRKKEWSSDWFYPVAVFFRIVTLSFLYRRSLLVLISNSKGWKSYMIPIIIFGIISGFIYSRKRITQNERMSYMERSEMSVYSSANYENIRSDDDVLISTIQSDIVKENTLKIFLKDLRIFNTTHRFDHHGKANWLVLTPDNASKRLNKWIDLKIDTTSVENIKWFRSQHPIDYDFGFISFIDIKTLERGGHDLTLSFDTVDMTRRAVNALIDENYLNGPISNIHFIYDKQ